MKLSQRWNLIRFGVAAERHPSDSRSPAGDRESEGCKATDPRLIFALILCFILGGVAPLYAAAKTPSKSTEKPRKASAQKSRDAIPPEQETSAANPAFDAAPSQGENAEKLLFTLNETLSENRKIRESMRDLQKTFEKVTIEKSDLADQVQKVEKLAIQRSKDTGRQVDALSAQLEESKRAMAKLQSDNAASVAQKTELEKKLEALSAENAKAQATLKVAILPEERDQIVARMDQNDASVREAVAQVSAMDGENVALREQVIESYFNLGNMYYDLGRYPEAVAQYRHVLEWNPQHAWAHHNLAVIYDYHFHNVHDAMVQYREYLHLKLASEEAKEARLRLWDLEQISVIAPDDPLKKDFKEFQKV